MLTEQSPEKMYFFFFGRKQKRSTWWILEILINLLENPPECCLFLSSLRVARCDVMLWIEIFFYWLQSQSVITSSVSLMLETNILVLTAFTHNVSISISQVLMLVSMLMLTLWHSVWIALELSVSWSVTFVENQYNVSRNRSFQTGVLESFSLYM